MRGRVVKCCCLTVIFIYVGNHRLTYFKGTILTFTNMCKGFALFACVFNNEVRTSRVDFALIAHLTTGFGIKRRVVQNDNALLPGMQFIDIFAINEQSSYNTFITHMVITTKNGFAINNQCFG